MVWEHFDYLIYESSPSIYSGISWLEQENSIYFVICIFIKMAVILGIN